MKLVINKREFLDWYYNTGADQDQTQMRLDLGNNAVDSLIDSGKFSIDVNEIWECAGYIPLTLVKNIDNIKNELREEEGVDPDAEDLYCEELEGPFTLDEVEWE